MSRKSSITLLVACFFVLGAWIARASDPVICWPYGGELHLEALDNGFDVFSTVSCAGEAGDECDSYINYVVLRWSPRMNDWVLAYHSAIYQGNACGTMGGTDQAFTLGSGTFHVDAYMYQGSPLHSGAELAEAHLGLVVP